MSMNRRSEGEGLDILLNFWEREYLERYIKDGGSKIKFVTGRKGAGTTYFLREFAKRAQNRQYLTVTLSAEEVWLHDFSAVYFAVLEHCDLLSCLKGCAQHIVREMGYDPSLIPEGQTFIDYLSAQGLADAITKKAMRDQLRAMFLQNPLLDNNFAISCSLLTGSILGHPTLDQTSIELLLGYLNGDKNIKMTALRLLNLSPVKITKVNARHMLRSLAEVVRMGGYAGLVICIDDLDILQSKSGNDHIRYTKMRRDDTYESIRQLIDDIDSLRGIMFVYGFDRILMDNEKAGLKSYQALWMRIQNEVVGTHVNCFNDIANLDALSLQEYTPEYLINISQKIMQQWIDNQTAEAAKAHVLSGEEAQQVLENSRFSSVGMAAAVREAMTAEIHEDTQEGGEES